MLATKALVTLSGKQVAAVAEFLQIDTLTERDALKFVCISGEECVDNHGSWTEPVASCQNLSAQARTPQDAVDKLIGLMLKSEMA